MLKSAAAAIICMAFAGPAPAQEVRSYASQIKDVDAVNTHWIETESGLVIVDAQRLLPEALRALEHVRASSGKPVIAIFITHAHTDHYGGLPVWMAAYPDADIYLTDTTVRSIIEDARGFNAARAARHGDRFAAQTALDAALARHTIISDGMSLDIDGITMELREFGSSEAESTLTVYLPDTDQLFVGDLINVGVPAVPFESLANWLDQLDEIARLYPTARIYQGHGPAPIAASEIALQREFLVTLRDLVTAQITDGFLSGEERDEIVFALESQWPFYTGVAGNTRREMLAFDANVVAEQLGAAIVD